MRDTEEKLRKLAPVDPRKADLSWLFYISGELEERQLADELLDIFLFQRIHKGYQEKIFLKPASASACVGDYGLGRVLYPPGHSYCPFGLREEEWIKHTLIAGMTGTGKTNLAFQILRELQLMKLVDVLKHAYFVGEGVEYLLREGIDWVYEHCGMFDVQSQVPTFFMVQGYVSKQRAQDRRNEHGKQESGGYGNGGMMGGKTAIHKIG